jgi:hypothetical protein
VATRGTQALLARLNRLNRTAVFLGVVALVIGGLLLPRPYGGVLLLALAAVLAALLTVTWEQGNRQARVARVAILALLVALAVVRLT